MFGQESLANDCYNDFTITLPNGREVTGKVPKLKKAFHFMTLLAGSAGGNNKATLKLLDEFPREVDLEDELNELTLAEFFDVVNAFFARRGSQDQAAEATAKEESLTLEAAAVDVETKS